MPTINMLGTNMGFLPILSDKNPNTGAMKNPKLVTIPSPIPWDNAFAPKPPSDSSAVR